jgi:hypothetical protein
LGVAVAVGVGVGVALGSLADAVGLAVVAGEVGALLAPALGAVWLDGSAVHPVPTIHKINSASAIRRVMA